MLQISVMTDGDAFEPPATGRECARILRNFAAAFECGAFDGSARFIVRAADANGNGCAVADYEPEPDAEPERGE
jgi:hypothetical protein